MKSYSFMFILFLCSMLLAGCVQKKIIDDVNIGTGVGIDKHGDRLQGSVMIPVFNPDKSVDNFTFSAEGTVTRDIVFQMQQKSSQPIVSGSLDIALFDDEVARDGLINFLDVFLRDPSVGARVYVAVVDGKAKDIFEGDYGDRGNARYLAELLEQNMETGNLPYTNLHRFLFDFYQKGQDPYLPLFKKVQPDLVNLIGLALFKDEKVVDTLDENKMFYFKLMVDNYSMGSLKIRDSHGESFIKSIRSSYKIKLTNRNPYEFTLKIKLEGILTEHTGLTFESGEVKELEKVLKKQIISESTKLLERFQKQQIDPIGLGHFAKSQTRNFDFKKWKESYPNARFKVDADVRILEVGVVE